MGWAINVVVPGQLVVMRNADTKARVEVDIVAGITHFFNAEDTLVQTIPFKDLYQLMRNAAVVAGEAAMKPPKQIPPPRGHRERLQDSADDATKLLAEAGEVQHELIEEVVAKTNAAGRRRMLRNIKEMEAAGIKPTPIAAAALLAMKARLETALEEIR